MRFGRCLKCHEKFAVKEEEKIEKCPHCKSTWITIYGTNNNKNKKILVNKNGKQK